MLTADGHAKIIDFGLVKRIEAADAADEAATATARE
jgi:hypothetical protein